jgi:hypothetical protein
MRVLPYIALLTCASACASKTSAPEAARPAATSAPIATEPSVAPSSAFPDGDAPDLVADDREWHARAKEAVAKGDLYLAKRILLRLVAGYRREKLFLEQHEWVQRRLDEDAAGPRAALKSATLDAVPSLPSSFRFVRAASVPARPLPKLALQRKTANGITDEERWFATAGPTAEIAQPPRDAQLILHIDIKDPATDEALQRLTLRGWMSEPMPHHLRNVPFPTWIPPTFGGAGLTRVIDSGAYTLVTYGERYLFVFDEARRLVRTFDVFLMLFPESHVARKPIKVGELTLQTLDRTASADLTVKDNGPRHDVQWAEARDGVLYVSTRFNGYAKEVKGQHAHVTAIELASGEVLFRSAPLTSNGYNFVLIGGAIVTGYGFTAEPDFVFVLDASNGKTVQKIAVPSSPEFFAWNESRAELLVRTYDHDLVFSVK